MRTRRLLPALALALSASVSAMASPVAAPEPNVMKWTIDGVERQALVFAPLPRPTGVTVAKRPVVFGFHGHGGDMRQSARSMRIQSLWPEAIVVYPQGLPTTSPIDPQGRLPGWQREAGQNGDRDLKLVDAVLAALREQYPVDDRRIYSTGFSNGSYFTYLLWATRGSVFAAFAPVSGVAGANVRLTVPRPVVTIGGETDRLVTYDRQKEALAAVRAVDGATGAGSPCGAGCTLYPSTQGAPVEAIVHPGGHVYPAWAPARIVEFLKAHPAAP